MTSKSIVSDTGTIPSVSSHSLDSTQFSGAEVAMYDTSNMTDLTDDELAKKAQEELNMEGEMHEVR